jgi:LSD1 subclass zinc finger protein
MWSRACPLCFVKVPRSGVLTRGEELKCPSCRTPLELSRASRVLSAAVGLTLAYGTANAVSSVSGTGGWVLPIAGAVVGFGVGSALTLYFLADLVVRTSPAVGHFPQPHK